MACNCVHHKEDIERGFADFEMLRELFIDRMTKDSETHDRRRKDYNQAIFHFESDEDIEYWNRNCILFDLPPKKHGDTYQVWTEINLDMVLKCFDNAVKDWRRTFCDVEGCRRK